MGPFLGGVWFGWVIMMGVSALPSSYSEMARSAMDECEKTLPRNQTCVIIAVPKEVKK